jgi:hypothetical protein
MMNVAVVVAAAVATMMTTTSIHMRHYPHHSLLVDSLHYRCAMMVCERTTSVEMTMPYYNYCVVFCWKNHRRQKKKRT